MFTLVKRIAASLALATALLGTVAAAQPNIEKAVLRQVAPDAFGAVALKIARTPFDREWAEVTAGADQGAAWNALLAGARGAAGRSAQLAHVNAAVNRRLRFVDDAQLYGRSDHWATPREALRRGAGDCEDYAILKMSLLRAAGVPARDIFLVIVKDTVARADHALLVVRDGSGLVVLDSRSDRIVSADMDRDYHPFMALGSDGSWLYGRRPGAEPASERGPRQAPAQMAALDALITAQTAR